MLANLGHVFLDADLGIALHESLIHEAVRLVKLIEDALENFFQRLLFRIENAGCAFKSQAFLAGDFCNAAFGGEVFFVAFLSGAGFEVVAAPSSAPAIRNFERSLASASHAGAGPRPLQVEPVLGSRYLGA